MSPTNPPTGQPPAVDVHAHFLMPDDQLLAQGAKEGSYAGPEVAWTPQHPIEFMDAHHIQMQLLSFPMQLPAETARRFNDYAASIVGKYPDRFGKCSPTSPWATRTPRRRSARSTGPRTN